MLPTTTPCVTPANHTDQLNFFPDDANAWSVTPAQSQLVLSCFPGIDILGRGFELAGFCVVRGPDKLWAGDIRNFHPPAGRFNGVIAGSPCQDFSKARRTPPTGEGLQLLAEYVRTVTEANPDWWVLENVPGVPDVLIPGWVTQRIDIRASEFGLAQKRIRHVQIGRRPHMPPLIVPRDWRSTRHTEPAALATDGRKGRRRSWPEFCELQGLPPLDLSAMTLYARYRAVGNGVPLPVARAIALSLVGHAASVTHVCACGCGRPVTARALQALPACRKRMERRRRQVTPAGVTL